MRHIVPTLTEGARRRCRLALSFTNPYRAESVLVSLGHRATNARRINVLQVAYFSSGVLV
jgi:hypothetical protein